ncbi:MAG: hypothetical protein ACRYFR_04990 [Janthinobacterium lividum]
MKRDHFLLHVEASGCSVKRPRRGNKPFVIVTNASGRFHAVNDNETMKATTVCFICRCLGIEVPDMVKGSLELVDEVRKIHGGDSPSD